METVDRACVLVPIVFFYWSDILRRRCVSLPGYFRFTVYIGDAGKMADFFIPPYFWCLYFVLSNFLASFIIL